MSELCFCLWYYVTASQTIAGLSVRAYVLDGGEDEKAVILRALSAQDYKLRRPSAPSPSLAQCYPRGVPYSIIRDLGVELVFAEEFSRIAEGLPEGIDIPKDKLFFATPLFDFGLGYVPAEIGNGFIRERE